MDRFPAKAVICFLIRDGGNEVLLAREKTNPRKGFWNGYSGRIEPGETREVTAVRELREECGVIVDPSDLEARGVIKRQNDNFLLPSWEIRIYVASCWEGEPQESEEMGPPEWFHRENIPRTMAFTSDYFWLPRVLEGVTVEVHCTYDMERKLRAITIVP